MILYFRSSHGEMRNIAQFDNNLSNNEALNAAFDEIRKFCDERKFIIYYTRIWNESYNGTMMTKFDVGSHTEFFYLNRELDIAALHTKKEDANAVTS